MREFYTSPTRQDPNAKLGPVMLAGIKVRETEFLHRTEAAQVERSISVSKFTIPYSPGPYVFERLAIWVSGRYKKLLYFAFLFIS